MALHFERIILFADEAFPDAVNQPGQLAEKAKRGTKIFWPLCP